MSLKIIKLFVILHAILLHFTLLVSTAEYLITLPFSRCYSVFVTDLQNKSFQAVLGHPFAQICKFFRRL